MAALRDHGLDGRRRVVLVPFADVFGSLGLGQAYGRVEEDGHEVADADLVVVLESGANGDDLVVHEGVIAALLVFDEEFAGKRE